MTAIFRQDLGNGLVLRTASSAEDVARIAAFNGIIHRAELSSAITSLATHFPDLNYEDMVLVEEARSGAIVSSLMLVPWTLSFAGVPLPVGEMAMVGTLEGYRRQGLVRAQAGYFMQRLRDRGCLLSLIQGIRYFYRQFGYEYAVPLEGGLVLSGRELPEPPASVFAFRQATAGDIPTLARLFAQAAQDLEIATVRDEATWRYLIDHSAGELHAETWLVEDGAGRCLGYVRLPDAHFGEELAVNEASRLSYDAGLAALHHLRALAMERGKPGIRLNLAANSSLMALARSLNACDLGTYAWQVLVPDLAALLRAVGPVLEARLARSPFAGLTRELRLCFYRASVAMHFAGGQLVSTEAGGPAEGEINFPLWTFTQVLFGYRTVEQLRTIYPDVSVAPHARLLFETLFPPMRSFIYPSY